MLKTDFHLHSNLSRCAVPEMTLDAILGEAGRLGVQMLGITDHTNLEQKAELAAMRERIRAAEPGLAVYFGTELNFHFTDDTFYLTPEQKREYGFQYVIGASHTCFIKDQVYDIKRIVKIQHGVHLKACEHPAIDVVGHPYRLFKDEFDRKGWPWFDSIKLVPKRIVQELGQASRRTGTAIEINATSNLTYPPNPPAYRDEYAEYIAMLAEEGATFAVGSDAHCVGEMAAIEVAWQLVEQVGIQDRIWRPSCPPLTGGAV